MWPTPVPSTAHGGFTAQGSRSAWQTCVCASVLLVAAGAVTASARHDVPRRQRVVASAHKNARELKQDPCPCLSLLSRLLRLAQTTALSVYWATLR